ncbi:hypothetical protein GCM10025873_09240 [Demequina sediminis]|nr:chorismate mutase [Demequina sediminis]BDZ61133.1 hypothetical protein GCM10025873_09240 [Demequina sediminis]
MTIRAIRGAITLDRDERDHLHARTTELVEAIMRENALTTDDLISVIFTCTPDIVSDFPAAAARSWASGPCHSCAHRRWPCPARCRAWSA